MTIDDFCNSDCTIINRTLDSSRKDMYLYTYIDKCFWDSVKGSSKSQLGLKEADQGLIVFFMKDIPNYLSPHKWKISNDKDIYFTLNVGDKIIKGIVDKTIPYKDIEKNYDDCLTITTIDKKIFGDELFDHIEVFAK